MAASTKHILTNVERMAEDAELRKLWEAELKRKDGGQSRTTQQAWAAFIAAADALRIANRIPGSVGRSFRARYEAEDTLAAVEAERPKAAAPSKPRTPAKPKPATKPASKKEAGQ